MNAHTTSGNDIRNTLSIQHQLAQLCSILWSTVVAFHCISCASRDEVDSMEGTAIAGSVAIAIVNLEIASVASAQNADGNCRIIISSSSLLRAVLICNFVVVV